MGAVQRFCDQALLLERGRMLAIGESGSIARKYMEVNFGRTVHESAPGAERFGHQGAAEILDGWFEDSEGERVVALGQGERCRIRLDVAVHEPLEDPIFAVTLRNEARQTVFAASSDWQRGRTGRFEAGAVARVRIEFPNWLAPSRYALTPSVARAGGGADVLDVREDLVQLVVHGPRVTGGVADLPHDFSVETA
jgi:hypothetical protein